jgi:hypothetical protein
MVVFWTVIGPFHFVLTEKMGKLSGFHIAITGTLSKVRAGIIKDIEKAGGTFSATVNGEWCRVLFPEFFEKKKKKKKKKKKSSFFYLVRF